MGWVFKATNDEGGVILAGNNGDPWGEGEEDSPGAVSREGDCEDPEVIAEVVEERQRIAVVAEPGEGIGEAWDNGTGLDIGPEIEGDTATTGPDGLMLELLGGEMILGPWEEDIVTSNESEEVAVQVSCVMALGSKREVGDLCWIKVTNAGYGIF